MSNNISANTPVLEGQDNIPTRFSRDWYRFLVAIGKKADIFSGSFTASAPLPPTPTGYVVIVDATGVERKVPYYDI